MAYDDHRLVDLYDDDNPGGADHDYYRMLADELEARTILDLGCGTGLLTVSFARPGRSVIGIDPSLSMLARATARPGGESVQWIHGDSRNIPTGSFDYAVMTANVAQHIDNDSWPRTLREISRALRPQGVLAFDTRNPRDRAWERWAAAPPTQRDTRHGPLREWMEVDDHGDGQVIATFQNVFEATDEQVSERAHFAFRERGDIEAHLTAAGFANTEIWGDWQRTPFDGREPMMVVEAQRAES